MAAALTSDETFLRGAAILAVIGMYVVLRTLEAIVFGILGYMKDKNIRHNKVRQLVVRKESSKMQQEDDKVEASEQSSSSDRWTGTSGRVGGERPAAAEKKKLPKEVWVSPPGGRYHISKSCAGLRSATRVSHRLVCPMCPHADE